MSYLIWRLVDEEEVELVKQHLKTFVYIDF